MSNAETGSLISRVYSGFRGADFRGEEVNLFRSPDCLNVWKDYKKTSSIETRPELELQVSFAAPVYGIFFFKGQMLVHSGESLYKVINGQKTTLFSGLKEATSNGFEYGENFYFKDGRYYLQYNGTSVQEVEGYVPTTSIARKPSGGGTIYEDVNMLNGRRINTFLADGGSFDFFLDTQNIDSNFPPIVKINGNTVTSGYTVDYTQGKISFSKAPDAPKTAGQDNVSVEFRKTVSRLRDSILNCTLLQVFDNRVFFSGNADYPNVVWHCSLYDPSYCSDLDFYEEGMDTAKIRGLVAGNNALWVFREPSGANTNIFYHTPTLDGDYGKIYPSTHSSITTGCIGGAINFNDDIVFFSERGAEGISGDVTTEQAVAHRSSLIDRKLLAEPTYKDMLLAEWEGYLFVFTGNNVYLADSRAMFTNENHYEYEWFYFELDHSATSVKVHDGVLYVGTENGIYTFSDTESPVESYWTTALDKFGAPNKMKTTNKRGCVVEAEGEEISVFVKTNKTDGFELVETFENIKDAFACRIKRKKWKDIQIRFHSKKRFRLESATLESFTGGYLKHL